jgi:hypothetical protein
MYSSGGTIREDATASSASAAPASAVRVTSFKKYAKNTAFRELSKDIYTRIVVNRTGLTDLVTKISSLFQNT